MSKQLDLHALRIGDAFRRLMATLKAAEADGMNTSITVRTELGVGGDMEIHVRREDLSVSVSSFIKHEVSGE